MSDTVGQTHISGHSASPSPNKVLLVCFAAMVIASIDRINISVAILAMQPEFGWSETVKGMVMAAFFAGYMATQIAGGWLSHRIGGERVLLVSLIAWSVFTVMTPIAAYMGVAALIAMRLLLGMSEGPCNPAAYSMLGRWIPDHLRPMAIATYGSGGFLGAFIALLLTGPMVMKFGWESAFYVFGVIGLLLALMARPWLMQLSKQRWQPIDADHGDGANGTATSKRTIPWRRLLGLRPFWALAVALFCTAWVYYVMLLWMPSYFERAFAMDVASSGYFSLAPWVIMFLVMNMAGAASAWLVRRGLSTTAARKLFTVGGLVGAAIALLVVPTAETPLTAMLLLSVALGFLAATYAGVAPNVFDIAPRYGEVLFSILNTLGSLPGVIGVTLTGMLVDLTGNFDASLQAAAALALMGGVVFLVAGTGARQVE